ncbi:MAG: sulfur oxidation c-type cytochrome SoxX [Rhodobacter sp.]|nr:sulfur oxidation c-type cytochrome SoxX [Rhodobacter sp.]
MKRKLCLVVAVGASLATPALTEVAPSEVYFAEGKVETSLTGMQGDAANGVKVMTTAGLGNCVACHTIAALPDVQFPGDIAPPLDGVADRWTEAELRGIVANAKMTFEGSFMPAFYKTEGFIRPGGGYTGKAPEGDLPPILTGQEIEDVVAFLLTLKE